MSTHRTVYEAHYGAIPSGCVVHHSDGDRTNNSIGNLVCLTPAEHVRLHRRQREAAGIHQTNRKRRRDIAPARPEEYAGCYSMSAAADALGRPKATVSLWLDSGSLRELPCYGNVRLVSAESMQRKAQDLGIELKTAPEVVPA